MFPELSQADGPGVSYLTPGSALLRCWNWRRLSLTKSSVLHKEPSLCIRLVLGNWSTAMFFDLRHQREHINQQTSKRTTNLTASSTHLMPTCNPSGVEVRVFSLHIDKATSISGPKEMLIHTYLSLFHPDQRRRSTRRRRATLDFQEVFKICVLKLKYLTGRGHLPVPAST